MRAQGVNVAVTMVIPSSCLLRTLSYHTSPVNVGPFFCVVPSAGREERIIVMGIFFFFFFLVVVVLIA